MYTVALTSHIQEDATWQTKQNKLLVGCGFQIADGLLNHASFMWFELV